MTDKIDRFNGEVKAFALEFQGTERTTFGTQDTSNELTAQQTSSYLRGWGIVGANEDPALEDFNAAMFTATQYISYLHQMGVAEWNALQTYPTEGGVCVYAGQLWNRTAAWTLGDEPDNSTGWASYDASIKANADNISDLQSNEEFTANDERAKTALNASGSAPIYACRAWVNFNGIGIVAIRASGNVSSITDNGVGTYTVNFIDPMTDANYSVTALNDDQSSRELKTPARSVSSVTIKCFYASTIDGGQGEVDPPNVNVTVFR